MLLYKFLQSAPHCNGGELNLLFGCLKILKNNNRRTSPSVTIPCCQRDCLKALTHQTDIKQRAAMRMTAVSPHVSGVSAKNVANDTGDEAEEKNKKETVLNG